MNKPLKDILVPVDFEEASLKAVEYAANMAARSNATIRLLHVLEIGNMFSEFFLSVDEVVKLTENIKERLLQIEGMLKSRNIEATTHIERGKPHQKILEAARQFKPAFIVLGENHQAGNMATLGSTVAQVTLHALAPVITINGDYTEVGSKLTVPLDLTKKTGHQICSAILFARKFNMKVFLVSALIGGINALESRIYKKLEQTRKTFEANKIDCEMKLFPRSNIPPYRRVLEYARETEASLILTMTHQEGFRYDNYIGAFAHNIINESTIPVLSFTYNAVNLHYGDILKSVIDPLNILKIDGKKKRNITPVSLRKSNNEKNV